MPLKRVLAFLILSCSLSSCFITNELFEEDEIEPVLDIQTRAEQNVAAAINESRGEATYKPYGFSQLKIKKPKALLDLEQLEAKLKNNPTDTVLIRQVEEKKAFIKKNRIERTAELDHFFALFTGDSTAISILEVNYFLNDTLGVVDMKPKILLEVPHSYELIVDYYANEYTIFIAQSYVEGRKMSNKFYDFFKTQLETFTSTTAKSNFLKHTLEICSYVKLTGKFEQDFIAQNIFKTYLKDKRADITAYEPLQFSDLYETKNNAENSVLGYYFFHKFIGNYNDQKDTNVVLVEFSPFYEVNQIFQMENSFESYTNKTE